MKKRYDRNNGKQVMNGWLWLLSVLLALGICGHAYALEYDTGSLNFATSDQSMWGSGGGVSIDEFLFLGTEWSYNTATIGSMSGGETSMLNPEYAVWWTAYQAWKALNPGPAPSQTIGQWILNPEYALWWTAYQAWQVLNPGPAPSPKEWCTFLGCIPNPVYWTWRAAYDAWQALNPGPAPTKYIYVQVSNPLYGLWLLKYHAYQAANPGPPPSQYVTIDTTTGAIVELTTSGKVGIQADFMLDSGTVDATADFVVDAELPDDMTVKAGQFFNLSPSSTFTSGTMSTQSPWIEASIEGVLKLAGTVSAQACLIGAGCIEGETALPTIDYSPDSPEHLEIFSMNPRDGVSLFETPLLAGTSGGLIVSGDLVTNQLKVETASGETLIGDSIPPGAILTELADITFQLPKIETEGEKDGEVLISSGDDMIVDADLDLDGLIAMGTKVPLNTELSLLDKKIGGQQVTIDAEIDFLDIDLGPTLNLFQDFELTPTLMVTLDFSSLVSIEGFGLVTSYTGAWDSLPNIALFETTTITPTFWLDAILTNSTGIDFGFDLSLAALSGSITGKIGDLLDLEQEFGPLWEDTIPLAEDLLPIELWTGSFALRGFNYIAGNAFTLNVSDIPEPGTLLLIGIGLLGLMSLRNRKR